MRGGGGLPRGSPVRTITDDPSGAPRSVPRALAASLRAPARAPDWVDSRTAPTPLGSEGRNRPQSPHPKASPPCGHGARAGAGRPAASSTIVRAPSGGAPLDRHGVDGVRTARLGVPRRAVRRLRHDSRASRPASDGIGAADLRTTVHPAHVSDPVRRVPERLRTDCARTRSFTVTLLPAPVKPLPSPAPPAAQRRDGALSSPPRPRGYPSFSARAASSASSACSGVMRLAWICRSPASASAVIRRPRVASCTIPSR